MSHIILSALIAGLLPIVCAGIAKWGVKNYDNHNPRAWLAVQEGHRARANAAQQNSFEAFPLFAAGVVLALVREVDTTAVAQCCWFFVLMRVLYIYSYVADRATLRSVVWSLGLAAVIRLFVLAM